MPIAPVPDDWDADEEEGENEQATQTLWEIAYVVVHKECSGENDIAPFSNSHTPMPQIQPSTTSTSAGAQLPPAAVFEAPLRILKRPSGASKSPSPLNGTQAPKSFKEREAQYQAARERIFGEEAREKTAGTRNDKPKSPRPAERPNIIRDPIGPTSPSADGETSRGFQARKKKKKGGHNTPNEPGTPPKDVEHASSGASNEQP